MQYEKIIYSESIETFQSNGTGLKKWKRLELATTLDSNDTPESAYKELKQKVSELLTPELVEVADAIGNGLPVQQMERSREEVIAAHLLTINECKTLRNLEMFANMVQRENEPVLFEAYQNRKKILQSI